MLKPLLILILFITSNLFAASERIVPATNLNLKETTTPATPTSGLKIYTKNDGLLYKLDSLGEELEVGAGAASGRLNLLENPSFERGVAEGSCISCTATEETSIVLGTVNNDTSLKIVQSSSFGAYTVNKTTGAEYGSAGVVASCYIKTVATGIQFKAMSNAAPSISIEVSSDNTWREYLIPFIPGATSIGWQVTGGTTSDIIYVDECFLGAKDVLNKVGYNTNPTAYTPTNTQGFGTLGTSLFKWHREGAFLVINATFTAGTTTGTEAQIELPNSYVIGEIGAAGIAGNVGNYIIDTSATSHGGIVLATSGDTFLNFTTQSVFGGAITVPTDIVGGSSVIGTGGVVAFNAKVPIQGWQATQDAYGDETIPAGTIRFSTVEGCSVSEFPFGQAAVSRTVYSELFAAIGTTFGEGDGSTTFVPAPPRGYALRVADLGAGNDPDAASRLACATGGATGDEVGTCQDDALQGHGHVLTHGTDGGAGSSAPAGTAGGGRTDSSGDHPSVESLSGFGTVKVAGETRMKNIAVEGCIRFRSTQIRATFKDVVMSPNSSNGKPVKFCASSNAAGTITEAPFADWVNGNAVVTSTSLYTISLNSVFETSSNIICNGTVVNTGDSTSIGIQVQSSAYNQVVFRTRRTTTEAADTASGFNFCCHGVRP